MASQKSIEEQLKKLGFNPNGWGRGEVKELQHIIMDDEEIYEVANGVYEGGFALLVATDSRILLIDQKPLNFLTVEDLRFDTINELDYSHRLFGARISISSGDKNLKFLSYNQPRLRKLITHVQHRMADSKKKQSYHAEDQSQHLERINKQLQDYLLAQQKQQMELQLELQKSRQSSTQAMPKPVKPNPELADFLYAQSLLAQHKGQTEQEPAVPAGSTSTPQPQTLSDDDNEVVTSPAPQPNAADIYSDAVQEIFGKKKGDDNLLSPKMAVQAVQHVLEINPVSIAYSKLPMALRNRKFGRPSFHAHSATQIRNTEQASAEAQPATT